MRGFQGRPLTEGLLRGPSVMIVLPPEGDTMERSSLGSPQGTFKIQTQRLTPRESDSIDWGMA